MSDLTSYSEQQYMEWCFDGDSFDTPPSELYVALHTGDPGNDGDANEVDGAGYDRVQTDLSDWNVSGSGPTEAVNQVDIEFPTADEDWGVIEHTSIWAGPDDTDEVLWQGELDSTAEITDGDTFIFEDGDFEARLD